MALPIEESKVLANPLRIWEVAVIVDAPVGGKTKDTVKKITNAEIKNEEKHRISNH